MLIEISYQTGLKAPHNICIDSIALTLPPIEYFNSLLFYLDLRNAAFKNQINDRLKKKVEYNSIEMDPAFSKMCCYLGVYVFSCWGKIGVSFCAINANSSIQ